MDGRKTVVSGCRRTNLVACLIFVGALALYTMHEDLTSDGLRRTQLFLAIGYGIYPLFYGACLFSLWKLVTRYRHADTFVTLDGPSLFVWGKEIPLRDISSITVRPGRFFLRWLVIARDDGSETKVSSVALAKPICEVAAQIKTAGRVS